MSMAWKECAPGDGWRARNRRPMHGADMRGLIHLYQPLVGAAAVGLYLTLHYQVPSDRAGVSDVQTHTDLMNLLQLGLPDLLKARYRLEGVGLLHTCCHTEQGRRLFDYEVIPPLSPGQFFRSDVLSITLLNRLGKDRYQSLKEDMIGLDAAEDRRGKDITKTFQQVYGTLSPEEIAAASELEQDLWVEGVRQIEGEEGQFPSFQGDGDDLYMVRARLKPILAPGAWTAEVERQLREIRFLYQLDDWNLIRALQNPYVTQNGHIDLNRLRSFVKSEYRMRFGSTPVVVDRKWMDSARGERGNGERSQEEPDQGREQDLTEEEKHFRALAGLSPLELLSHFHKGRQIPKADIELVEDLIHQYGLPHGVINVLLEYVLYSQDFKLPRPLVEKIAGHWARKNVRTVDEALEMARKELNWEWKRKSPGKPKAERKPRRQPAGIREDRLPRAVAEGMERRAQGDHSSKGEADPQAEARIREKLNRMRQRLSRRMNEKGNGE